MGIICSDPFLDQVRDFWFLFSEILGRSPQRPIDNNRTINIVLTH